MEFSIRLVNKNIRIIHRYAYIKKLCVDYLIEETKDVSYDLEVSITDKDLLEEQKICGYKFSKEICECTCIHREIVKGLVKYGIILMHSAVVEVDGQAYVFMAKSGVGKSTHIKLWMECFGDRARIVNGDKPMFLFDKEKLMVYGSPWRGKERFGENISMPVKAICLLERGSINEIKRADSGLITERIFHQVLLPKSQPELNKFLSIINQIIGRVPFYSLKCDISKEAALLAYEKMSGNGNSAK